MKTELANLIDYMEFFKKESVLIDDQGKKRLLCIYNSSIMLSIAGRLFFPDHTPNGSGGI